MCLIAFAWQVVPDTPLVVAANRDEWHERPAAPAAWWRDRPGILAGRDLKAGGTWLGLGRTGRFAALTNFRDPAARKPGAPSRGKLVADFIDGTMSPQEYLAQVRVGAQRFPDFNLLVGDTSALWILSSREDALMPVPPGVHALSNHSLDVPWPKVAMAKSRLDAALRAEMAGEARQMAIRALLSDATPAPDEALPDTGVGLEWERVLSPALIIGERYGTRCSTIVSIDARGGAAFEELTRGTDGRVVRHANYVIGA